MYDPNIKPARSNQWNVDIQRQMAHNILLTAAYVGAKSDRLNVTGLFNVATTAGPGTTAAGCGADTLPLGGHHVYGMNPLAPRITIAFSCQQKSAFLEACSSCFAYTWSKAMDDGGSGYFGVENGPGGFAAVQKHL